MSWWKKVGVGISMLLVAVVAGVLIFAPGMVESDRNTVIPHPPWPVSDEARALHERLIVGDWHADPLLWKRDLTERADRGQVDLPRLREGNVALQVFAAPTKSPAGQNYQRNSADATDNITLLALIQLWPPRTWGDLTERALYQSEKLHRYEEARPAHLSIVCDRLDLEDVLARRETGQDVVGGILALEGMHALEGDLANLDRLWEAGYRIWGLTHFFDNEVAASLHGEEDTGLTELGRELVREAIARDALLDLAHASPRTVRQVLEMTDEPVIVSHGGTHNHCPVKRNLPDELMRAVAEAGGVVGIGYWEDAVCGTTPGEIVDAIAAAIELLGEDHVSLGSDFDGSVETHFDTSELAALTHEMLTREWSEERIAKVMGGNMVRVLRETLPE